MSAQMRQFQQIVQIVDRVPERAHFAQLLFGRAQVLLHFFELGKAFLDVLVEFRCTCSVMAISLASTRSRIAPGSRPSSG